MLTVISVSEKQMEEANTMSACDHAPPPLRMASEPLLRLLLLCPLEAVKSPSLAATSGEDKFTDTQTHTQYTHNIYTNIYTHIYYIYIYNIYTHSDYTHSDRERERERQSECISDKCTASITRNYYNKQSHQVIEY